MKFFYVFALIVTPSFSFSSQATETKPATQAAAKKADLKQTVQRIVIVGASVSEGFGNQLPVSKVFESAVHSKHEAVMSYASSIFFMQAIEQGKEQVDKTLSYKPSLVVGVDFLFWYAYGRVGENEIQKRMEKLEKGLEELNRIETTLVLGDIPDMRNADPKILNPAMVPSVEALEKINSRISEWAKTRSNVLLVPLSDWVKKLKEEKMIVPVGKEHLEFTSQELLLPDRLHSSQKGQLLLVHRLISEIKNWLGNPKGSELDLNLKKALKASNSSSQSEEK